MGTYQMDKPPEGSLRVNWPSENLGQRRNSGSPGHLLGAFFTSVGFRRSLPISKEVTPRNASI